MEQQESGYRTVTVGACHSMSLSLENATRELPHFVGEPVYQLIPIAAPGGPGRPDCRRHYPRGKRGSCRRCGFAGKAAESLAPGWPGKKVRIGQVCKRGRLHRTHASASRGQVWHGPCVCGAMQYPSQVLAHRVEPAGYEFQRLGSGWTRSTRVHGLHVVYGARRDRQVGRRDSRFRGVVRTPGRSTPLAGGRRCLTEPAALSKEAPVQRGLCCTWRRARSPVEKRTPLS